MDIRIDITCNHKCVFNWNAFEAQFNKANKFPGSINIIVLSAEFWFMKKKKSFKHIKLAA